MGVLLIFKVWICAYSEWWLKKCCKSISGSFELHFSNFIILRFLNVWPKRGWFKESKFTAVKLRYTIFLFADRKSSRFEGVILFFI